MLFDTDILIWHFRGNPRASSLIDLSPERCLSIISYMELFQGAKNRAELLVIKKFLADFSFGVLPLGKEIGQRAATYIESFALSHYLFLADALIAATAVENNMALVTGNRKHFSFIQDLEIKVFRP
ncbi:MAG: type II toxin-antitoxin system VapC family toxin [Candidatus Sumerlaeota bacterium]|nr:type II toxin-antitoxin system VapC family toxin [Candidatus Sumerlaeota bacterium]